ncbi:uncharacterized protein LOC129278366 [Lytechinus pictus]|uniref:uncharacterized protein LOC129278366 n=1 Tax=Lytechinus pictus TaxID=7653 RepID=UPI0030BA08E4
MSYDLRKSQKGKHTKTTGSVPTKRPNPFSHNMYKALPDQLTPSQRPGEPSQVSSPANTSVITPVNGTNTSTPDRTFQDQDFEQSKLDLFLTKKFEAMLERAVDRLAKKIEAVESLLGDSLEFERQRVNDLQVKQNHLETRIKNLEEEVAKNGAATNKSERFSRRNNIRLVGIDEYQQPTSLPADSASSSDSSSASEPHQEDCITLAEDKLRSFFGITSKVERAHRDGRKTNGRPRHILVKLLSYRDKVDVMKRARSVLKNQSFFIIDDLTSADLQEKRKWSKQVQALYAQGTKLRFYAGKWRLRGGDPFNFESSSDDTSRITTIGHAGVVF